MESIREERKMPARTVATAAAVAVAAGVLRAGGGGGGVVWSIVRPKRAQLTKALVVAVATVLDATGKCGRGSGGGEGEGATVPPLVLFGAV